MHPDLTQLEQQLKASIARATAGYKLALRPLFAAHLCDTGHEQAQRRLYHGELKLFVPLYRAVRAYNQVNHTPKSRARYSTLYIQRVLAVLSQVGAACSPLACPDFADVPLWVSTPGGGRFITVREYQAERTEARKSARGLIQDFRESLTPHQHELVKKLRHADVSVLSLADLR